MSNTDQFQYLISAFAMYIPTLLVSIVACIMAITKWKHAPDAAMWALFGFGLTFLLCITTPVGQFLIQRWVFEAGGPQGRVWVFTVFGFTNAILHAIVYIFLAVAIFAGRPKSG